MGNESEDVASPYGPDDLKQFAKILGIQSISAEHTEQLQNAALGYIFLAETESKPKADEEWRRFLPLRSERRKALQRVSKAARNLKEALGDRALMFLDEDKLPSFDTQGLDELTERADHTARQIPMGGADPNLARIVFVRRLAEIFEHATQRPASRRHDPISGLDCGPFLEFVKAALSTLDEDVLKGLEHVVRRVAADRRPK